MKLGNCGCSFAHGHMGNVLPYYEKVQEPGLPEAQENGHESAAYHISQQLQMTYVDLARNGNSNEAIIRTLRTYLYHNDKKDLFVLIGWTHAFRREYMAWNRNTNCGDFVQYREIPTKDSMFSHLAKKLHAGRIGRTMVEFNERPNRPLSFDDHVEFRQYNIMLQSQQLLQLLGIPYLMYNSCGNEHESTNREILEIKAQIDKSRFYNFNGPSYDQYLQQHRDLLSSDGGHPGPLGYKKLAEMLLPKIKELLT